MLGLHCLLTRKLFLVPLVLPLSRTPRSVLPDVNHALVIRNENEDYIHYSSVTCIAIPCDAPRWQRADSTYPYYSCGGSFHSLRTVPNGYHYEGNRDTRQSWDTRTQRDGGRVERPGQGRLRVTPADFAGCERGQRRGSRHTLSANRLNSGSAVAKRQLRDSAGPLDPLHGWLSRIKDDVKSADKQITPATSPAQFYKRMDMTALEAVPRLLPQQSDDGLRPLGSRTLRGGGSGASFTRFDPQLLPEVVRISYQASLRLRFITQLPDAVATYVATAAQRGVMDLATQDVSFCKALLLYLGHAQVVNRECLDELHKALQPRWSQLSPDDLVQVLVALGRLNDANRVAAVGRPGAGSSRLLRMLVDAEPCVTALLEADKAATAAKGGASAAAEVATVAAAKVVEAAAAGGGSADGVLSPCRVLQLALAHLSFYRSAKSGHQHSATAIMLQHSLESCLARLDVDADIGEDKTPSTTGKASIVPADDLGRLVAGLAGVTLVRDHGLAVHLPKLVRAVTRRASELSQPVRALLLELPQRHWALSNLWRRTLMAKMPMGGGKKAAAGRKPSMKDTL